MNVLVKKIASELNLTETHSQNAIKLLFEEDCTIPFVARYRKEVTGSMDEVKLRDLRDRYTYLTDLEATKVRYLKVVEEHCKSKPELAAKLPELKAKFEACENKQALEDLYLPFKPKRRTRAQIAKEKGLEPLLNQILEQRAEIQDLTSIALPFVTPADKELEKQLIVASAEAALAGAADLYAERIHETADIRSVVRNISFTTGMIVSKKVEKPQESDESSAKKKKVSQNKYENYFDYKEPIKSAVSHRIMAVRRGEAEKALRLSIEVDSDKIIQELCASVLGNEKTSSTVADWIKKVAQDAYSRLIAPSIETEIRLFLKNKAEEEAIKVFSTNLENLLLLPPIPGRIVMGIDPGLRTGSKLAVVSQTGKLLDHTTIYPHPEKIDAAKSVEAMATMLGLLQKHKVEFIAIGNGTGSREIDQLVIKVIRDNDLKIKRLVVNEAGASVYSTADIAREEFPDLDPTIRSAVCIARRLQDPLAELVKIDPRSIGVGQYQHDCNVTKLTNSLKETVESCVNRVGVNVNTASYKLLSYVSGIGPTLARNIVSYRDSKGSFGQRMDLNEVSGFGPKAFQQAAGFLKVPNSANPLDNSSVHPECYSIVERISNDLNTPILELIGKKETVEAISLEEYVNEEVGMPTLLDIASELVKPGRDPREDGSRLTFSEDVACIEDLEIGMKLKGTVSNVTNFGAFVDIGVHQDGLVHVSELSDQFVTDPATIVAVGDVLDIYVLDVEVKRKRISLSCKKPVGNPKQAEKQNEKVAANSERNGHNAKNRSRINGAKSKDATRRPSHRAAKSSKASKQYSMGDLLNKFNNK